MAILRAGPWATPTDSFVDAPDNFDTFPPQDPVNCALNDWVGDTWKALFEREESAETNEYGTASLGEDIELTSTSFISGVTLSFYYQAANGFDADFNWSVMDVGAGDSSWDWSYSTIEGDSRADFGDPIVDPSGNDSGTETISLPASTLGFLIVGITTLNGGTTSASISDPS